MNNDNLTFSETDMVPAPCVHFGACGGCQFQNIRDESYQNYKRKFVTDLLASNNITPQKIHDPIFIPEETRRRVTFACQRNGSEVVIGFHARKSHEIIPISHCLLITDQLQSCFDKLKTSIHPILKDKTVTDLFLQEIDGDVEMVITGILNPDRSQSDLLKHVAHIAEFCGLARIGIRKTEFDEIEILISLKNLQKNFSGLQVTIPIGSFLQPSQAGEAALVHIVTSHLPQKKKFTAMDLFAGCGTFTGALLTKAGQVTAVEIDPLAVHSLQKSLGGHGKSRAEQRHLYQEPVVSRELRGIDVVVLDPPRAGAKEQAQMLAKSTVPSVIYVSCHAPSFMRDASILIKGGYDCMDIYIVDQFKWSTHTEIVGVFSKQV